MGDLRRAILVIAITTVVVGYASGIHCIFKAKIRSKNACRLSPIVFRSKDTVNGSTCGKTFNTKDFDEVPTVQWSGAEENAFYTLIFRRKHASTIYWAVSNIPGTALLEDGDIKGYNQLMGYRPPEFHQYTFISLQALIYIQDGKFPNINRHKQLKKFIKKRKLCGPKAGLGWQV